MLSKKIDSDQFIENLINSLPPYDFFTLKDLRRLKILGSPSHSREVLRRGDLCFIQVSSRRKVVPRFAVLEYLKNNFSINNREESCNLK